MIRILSRKLIKPSKATTKEERKMKLSAIDEVAPPAYEPIILYYHEFNNNDKMIHSFYPMSTSLERLEKSLSETLSCFYPLAGRFNIDENNDLVIDCNDEGLEYWNVRVDEKLDQFIDTAFTMTAEHLNHLVPYGNEMAVMINSSSRLVAMIQINIFKCGGIAICVAISHKIADGFTVVSFINGWATALKVGVHQVNKPSFNLASIFPPVPAAMRLETPINLPRLKIPNLKLVTKRFFFNRKAISILKEKVAAKLADDDYYPSSVEVVTALIWKALMAVSQVKHKTRPKQLSRRPSLAIHSFNLRGKIISLDNIPKNSCGNLYRLLSCYFLRKPANKEEEEEEAMSVVQLHDLVCVFKKAVRNCNDICRKVENGEQVSLMVHKSWREVIVEEENFATIDAHVYLFTSLCKFPFYEADFGWGKPIWVSSVNKFLEMVMLFDTNLSDGVEAWVTLNSNDMLLFENDADILAFNQQHN